MKGFKELLPRPSLSFSAMRELKREDPSELELGLELELESDDVDAAEAAVAAVSAGCIPCSCCNELLENADQLHVHQMSQHSVGELSLALLTLRGLDISLVSVDMNVRPAYSDDSSHLRNILLNSIDRPRESDSESTITVTSEARMNMMSPVSSPSFSTSDGLQDLNTPVWSSGTTTSYYRNPSVESTLCRSETIGNSRSSDSGFWSSNEKGRNVGRYSSGRKNSNNNNGLDVRQFFCDVCGRGYKKKSHLDRHLRVHTGVRPYECPTCEKRFAVRSILKQHIRVHTGERPFSCNICAQRFPQKSGLMTHMMLHNGKPFKCEFCVKSFVSNHKLMLHQRSHQNVPEGAPHLGPHSCSSCDMRFFTTGALSQHMKVHVNPRNQTPIKRNKTNEAITITEEDALVAVSAVSNLSSDLSVFQDDLIDIVKDEVIFENDYEDSMNDTEFFCEARWNEVENMCFESHLIDPLLMS